MKSNTKSFVCALALSLCLVGVQAQAENYSYTPAATQTATTKIDYTQMSAADMNALVQKIGTNILRANNVTTPVTFSLVEKNDANAYADGSNNVVVYSGLIQYCENEDELAFVIGHEIGHAASNHVIKGVVTDVVASVATAAGKQAVTNALSKSKIAGKLNKVNAYTGINVTSMANKGVEMTANAGTSKVSRNFENDADALGMSFLANAGYNPLAGISIMYKIGSNYSDFWADHPSTDKRIMSMYEYVNTKYPQYTQKGFNVPAYNEAVQKYIK